MTHQPPTPPTTPTTIPHPPLTPHQCIARLQQETAALQTQRAQLQTLLTTIDTRIKQNQAEQLMHARLILDGKAPRDDPTHNLTLNPHCKYHKTRTKPDIPKMKQLCPDLLDQLGKVNDTTAMRILETAHNGDKHWIQHQLRTLDPHTYWEKIQVNLTDLTPTQAAFLEDNGIITTTWKITGDPTVMTPELAHTLLTQTNPKLPTPTPTEEQEEEEQNTNETTNTKETHP